MVGNDLDPDLLAALEASTKQFEAEEKARKERQEAEDKEEDELALRQVMEASELEYFEQQSKSNEAIIDEEEKELLAAIALSKQSASATSSVSNTTNDASTQLLDISEVEAMRLQRVMAIIMKIPGAQVKDCLEAIKTQKRWDKADLALSAYQDSTTAYSAQGLIAFMNALAPEEAVTASSETSSTTSRKKQRL